MILYIYIYHSASATAKRMAFMSKTMKEFKPRRKVIDKSRTISTNSVSSDGRRLKRDTKRVSKASNNDSYNKTKINGKRLKNIASKVVIINKVEKKILTDYFARRLPLNRDNISSVSTNSNFCVTVVIDLCQEFPVFRSICIIQRLVLDK